MRNRPHRPTHTRTVAHCPAFWKGRKLLKNRPQAQAHHFIDLFLIKVKSGTLTCSCTGFWLVGLGFCAWMDSPLRSRCKVFIGSRGMLYTCRGRGTQRTHGMWVWMWNTWTPTTGRNELVQTFAHVCCEQEHFVSFFVFFSFKCREIPTFW